MSWKSAGREGERAYQRRMNSLEQMDRENVVHYAKQIQQQTGARWSDCIRVAEHRNRLDRLRGEFKP